MLALVSVLGSDVEESPSGDPLEGDMIMFSILVLRKSWMEVAKDGCQGEKRSVFLDAFQPTLLGRSLSFSPTSKISYIDNLLSLSKEPSI